MPLIVAFLIHQTSPPLSRIFTASAGREGANCGAPTPQLDIALAVGRDADKKG
jgi:hypothetical protein